MLAKTLEYRRLPAFTGFARGEARLTYIGQTGRGGMNIRKRLRMLKGAYGAVIPFRDPHTAGPAMWALIETGARFDASGIAVAGEERWRRSLEAVAIALYRQHNQCSPAANFGRMPRGYTMSSGRNARLRAAGKLQRGSSTTSLLLEHAAGAPPAGPLEGDPIGLEWCGHGWNDWLPIRETARAAGANSTGLYRLRLHSARSLLYVGEGRLARGLRSHAREATTPHTASPRDSREILASFTTGAWLSHQREELETDMVGAYVLRFGGPPTLQFLGRNRFIHASDG